MIYDLYDGVRKMPDCKHCERYKQNSIEGGPPWPKRLADRLPHASHHLVIKVTDFGDVNVAFSRFFWWLAFRRLDLNMRDVEIESSSVYVRNFRILSSDACI